MGDFVLKEGTGFMNRDNENADKFWGSFKVDKDYKKSEQINLTEYINRKEDGKEVHKLQVRRPKV